MARWCVLRAGRSGAFRGGGQGFRPASEGMEPRGRPVGGVGAFCRYRAACDFAEGANRTRGSILLAL
jgi:hypothetical protein